MNSVSKLVYIRNKKRAILARLCVINRELNSLTKYY